MGDYNYYAFQEIGRKIIYQALSNAQFAITHSNNGVKDRGSRYRQGLEDLKMLENGELDKLVEYFYLEFDPEKLKTQFFYYVRRSNK